MLLKMNELVPFGPNVCPTASLATQRAMRGLVRAQPLPAVEGRQPPRRVGRSECGTAATKSRFFATLRSAQNDMSS